MTNFLALLSGDRVIGKSSDLGLDYVALPTSLDNTELSRLRFNGTTVVDATAETTFFIDDNAIKHLQNLHDDAVKLTGTFTFNRRGTGLNDRVERASGSFVTDGIKVGSWVSFDGTTDNDGKQCKVVAVNALNFEVDETINRLKNESSVSCDIHQGWQRVEGIGFFEKPNQTADGEWKKYTDDEKVDLAVDLYKGKIADAVKAHILQSFEGSLNHMTSPEFANFITERSRDRWEAVFSSTRIVNAGWHTFDDLLGDAYIHGKRIYEGQAGATSGVSLTFAAATRTITRASGDFSTDGYKRGMTLKVSDSSSNNGKFTLQSVSALELKVISDDSLTDETVIATLEGTAEVLGYARLRGGDANKARYEDWMVDAVVYHWTKALASEQKAQRNKVKNATAWASSTSYSVGDFVVDLTDEVEESDKIYECNTAHTSGTDREDDEAKWTEYEPKNVSWPDYPDYLEDYK